MILGALTMIVANGATLLGARAILSRVRTGRPAPDAVLFLVLRLLLISGVIILAGLTRTLGPLGMGVAGAAACAVLVWRGAHRGLPRILPLPWNRWLTLVAALIAVRLLLQVWFFAPFYGDVLSYHLPKVAEWVQAGAFTREMGSDPRASFPAGFELVEIWWTAFLHHDVLIEMAGVELLLLACASAYALAREFGWSSSCSMGAAILVGMIPGLHLQATSGLNDGAVAGWIAATAALTAARVHPGLVLTAVGLGIGTKPTFAFALPGLLLFGAFSRRLPAAPPPGRFAVGLLAGGGLFVGGFWYLRNLVFFGNPIHPMGSAGMASLTGLPLQRIGPSPASLVDNLRSLIDVRIYDHVAPLSASHAAVAGWGALVFAIGVPALLYLARTEERLGRLALSFFVSLVCVWSLVVFDLHSARFVLFAPLVPALAAARFVERHRFALPLAALAVALQFWTTILPGDLDRSTVSRMAGQSWRERTASPDAIEEPAGSSIGYLSDYSGTPYWLYGPGFSHPVVYLRENSIENLSAALRAHQIRFLSLGVLGEPKRQMMQAEEKRGLLRSQGILVR
jgi:hypothetical protein